MSSKPSGLLQPTWKTLDESERQALRESPLTNGQLNRHMRLSPYLPRFSGNSAALASIYRSIRQFANLGTGDPNAPVTWAKVDAGHDVQSPLPSPDDMDEKIDPPELDDDDDGIEFEGDEVPPTPEAHAAPQPATPTMQTEEDVTQLPVDTNGAEDPTSAYDNAQAQAAATAAGEGAGAAPPPPGAQYDAEEQQEAQNAAGEPLTHHKHVKEASQYANRENRQDDIEARARKAREDIVNQRRVMNSGAVQPAQPQQPAPPPVPQQPAPPPVPQLPAPQQQAAVAGGVGGGGDGGGYVEGAPMPAAEFVEPRTESYITEGLSRRGGGMGMGMGGGEAANAAPGEMTDANKGVQRLKREIQALHLVYEDKIKAFKAPEHQAAKMRAMGSSDLDTVRGHHKGMMDAIAQYYSKGAAGMRIGVIVDAEQYAKMTGGNHGGGVAGAPVGAGNQHHVDQVHRFRKGENPFARAIDNQNHYQRGGMDQYKQHGVYGHKLPQRNQIRPFKIRDPIAQVDMPYQHALRRPITQEFFRDGNVFHHDGAGALGREFPGREGVLKLKSTRDLSLYD